MEDGLLRSARNDGENWMRVATIKAPLSAKRAPKLPDRQITSNAVHPFCEKYCRFNRRQITS
jgi:hypothetical protein